MNKNYTAQSKLALKRGGQIGAKRERQKYLKRVAKWQQNPKRCKGCKQSIPYDKRRNNFCSHSCSAKLHNKKRAKPKNKCLCCQKETTNKKYCSQKCQWLYYEQEGIKKWKNGELPGGNEYGQVFLFVRKYLFLVRGEKCEKCGWAEIHPIDQKVPLTIHHKGKYNDHREQMLEILCPNCHSLTESYCGRNKGKGRPHRRMV
jgi:predicted nucleic acid-binding Zn ribbon protein